MEQALHFSETDLEANRAGRLTATQRARLWGQDWIKLLAGASCLAVGVVFQIGVFVGWMPVHGRGAALGFGLIALGVIVLAISALQSLDLINGSVSTAEGVLGFGDAPLLYQVVVNGVTFNVPKTVFDTVTEVRWRVYYLRRSQTVLSMEPVRTGASAHHSL